MILSNDLIKIIPITIPEIVNKVLCVSMINELVIGMGIDIISDESIMPDMMPRKNFSYFTLIFFFVKNIKDDPVIVDSIAINVLINVAYRDEKLYMI